MKDDISNRITIEMILSNLQKRDPEAIKNYIDCEEDDLISIIKYFYFEVLNWCGCGEPGDAMRTISKFLNAINEMNIELREIKLEKAFNVRKIYDSDLLLCLAYSLDAAGLIEHGTSIHSCWLTLEGAYFCWAIDEAYKEGKLDI